MRDGRLVEFSRRMNEIRREFLRISEDIPENFKSQYAAYEIKKRQNNLIQHNLEQGSVLTIQNLLLEMGKTTEYVASYTSSTINKLIANGFNFDNTQLCINFRLGTNATQPIAQFTPCGYLLAISFMTNRFTGREFRLKYLKFQADSAVLVTRLDQIVTEQTRYLMDRVLSLERKTNRLTNQTQQAFWAHCKLLLKKNNKRPPTFVPWNWNHNANKLSTIKDANEGLLTRVDNGVWVYVDEDSRQIMTENIENRMNEFE